MKIVIADGPEPTERDVPNADAYPAGWFDAPIAIIDNRCLRLHHRIVYQPWAQDNKRLGRWIRSLVELHDAQPRRRGYLPQREWRSILDSFDHRCAYCGVSGVPLEKDHVEAWSKGGSDDASNIVPACKPCNRTKRDQPAEDWPFVVVPHA